MAAFPGENSSSDKPPRIDAHHHLWNYTPDEFGWIGEDMAVLRRDFSTQEFDRELASQGFDGAISVQARQTVEETRWLCRLAGQSSGFRGVVGWAPIASEDFPRMLESLGGERSLVGLRHIVQAEAPGFLDREDFNRGLRELRSRNLTYDLLILDRQMEETAQFVDRHPHQPFVLDHAAKPRIAAQELEPWRSQLIELARREHVSCKLSGFVTEANWSSWTIESLWPYLDACVEAFGTNRLLAGSDWPVCLVASSFERWWSVLHEYFAAFSQSEQEQVFGANAIRVYGLMQDGGAERCR